MMFPVQAVASSARARQGLHPKHYEQSCTCSAFMRKCTSVWTEHSQFA